MTNQAGLWQMVAEAGPIVKLVLLTLLIFSIISWAIIIYKMLLLRKVEKEGAIFYDLFWDKSQFSVIEDLAKNYANSPLTALFNSAYAELKTIMSEAEPTGNSKAKITAADLERIKRILVKRGAAEMAQLEYVVPFLATTGNTAPFIGLFGTVWGIMNSFRSIGAQGSANLAVVAPGISEALVATALGLLVAIPAVVGYNHLTSRTGRVARDIDSFSSDLINVIEKQLIK